MSDEKRSGMEVRTPMRMNLSPEQAQAIPGLAEKMPPMAGSQEASTTCPDVFRQLICVEGTVTTTVNAECNVSRIVCLGGGVGSGCQGNVVPPPAECTFKFFENLCVEVSVTVSAEAECEITGVVCGEASNQPCPTPG